MGNNVERKYMILNLLLCGFTFLLLYSLRFYLISPYAGTWDTVDFSLALDRFDLLEMQPHFPGYPYFIIGGMFLHQWIENPSQALALYNVVLFLTATIPMYLLVRNRLSILDSLIGVLFLQSFSFYSAFITEPMSEGAALSILWWYLWSLAFALSSQKLHIKILPAFFLSLLLGIRFSYIPFGLGLVYIWFVDFRKTKGFNRLMYQVLLAIGFQLIWVYALAYSLGGWNSFMKISLSFVEGHFNDWGGTAVSDRENIVQRFFILLFYNVFWNGFSVQSILIIILGSILLLLLVVKKSRMKYSHIDWLLIGLSLIYFFWALVGQNIEKPRHIIPLIGLWGYIFYIKYINLKVMNARYNNFKLIFLFLFIFTQAFYGSLIMKEKVNEMPASYQLSAYLESTEEDFIVYTWEETRVFEYLQASFDHKRVLTFEYFLEDVDASDNKKIYLTDHVVEGFNRQGHKMNVTEVARFQSNSIVDPVYSTIVLYEWIQ